MRFIFEWPAGLGLAVGLRLLQPFDLVPFVLGGLVEGAKRVLDTLHGAGRIIRIDVRRIGSRATDEKVWHGCAGFVSAQDLESPETCPQPGRILVAA